MALLSANIVVCESVIWEQNSNVPTLVRAMSVINVEAGLNIVRFTVLTVINSQPGDSDDHFVFIHIVDMDGTKVASTEPHKFTFGSEIDPHFAGGFTMTTTVFLNVSELPKGLPCGVLVQAFLDDEKNPIAATPLLLRRAES